MVSSTLNSMTGIQLVASQKLQSGEGLAPPNIAANLAAYSNISTVNNFQIIYNNVANVPGVWANSITILQSIGANSFPHLFGQIPGEFSSELGSGPLFEIAPRNTANLFQTGSTPTANVFVQALGQAQSYAVTAAAVINSAATTQWAGGPSASVTGGFSTLGGNTSAGFSAVATALSQLGTLMLMATPVTGFSNAGCFKQISDAGNNTIGNLHINFFGKTITDPLSGIAYIIGPKLFDFIISGAQGRTATDSVTVAALNPLDALLGQAADAALTQTGDLDAVVTFFGVSGSSAAAINNWTDCLNLPLMCGPAALPIISAALNVPVSGPFDAYALINAIQQNITGYTNFRSIGDLGTTMLSLEPLSNAPNIAAMTSPVSQSDFANIKAGFGPGSGTNGNPTVNDILGATNFNEALAAATAAITPLISTAQFSNISSDTGNIATGIMHGGNVFPLVTLSNGMSYSNINTLAPAAAVLIDSNANALANIAPSLTNTNALAAYNNIASTHNNSVALGPLTGITSAALIGIATNAIAAFDKLSGLAGLIMGLVHKYHAPSTSILHEFPPSPAIHLALPGPIGPGALAAFPASLASMVSTVAASAVADEMTGLSTVSNLIDTSTVGGQALSATMTEAKNAQALSTAGIPSTILNPNPSALITTIGGGSTIGGLPTSPPNIPFL